MSRLLHRLKYLAVTYPIIVAIAAFIVCFALIQIPPPALHLAIPISLLFGWGAYHLSKSWSRDLARAEKEERVIGEINHHVNNALTVIRNRKSLPESQSDEAVEKEIERIVWALREVLPTIREK